MTRMHTPVLLHEAIDGLAIRRGGKYIDATFGEGGHSREILMRGGYVLGIEWNETQYQKSRLAGRRAKINYQKEILETEKLQLVCGNFADIEKIARENNFFPSEGVLFDLGLSMTQIDEAGRGFSYKKRQEPLDMRMNMSLKETAADMVNRSSPQTLYEIFAKNAEEINSLAIAHAFDRARRVKKIETVGDALDVLYSPDLSLRGKREGMVRRIFQALRIAVNHEFENLRKGLEGAFHIVTKGRIVIITFHQGEERIVKQFARNHNISFLTKKPIKGKVGTFERSAKLRIIEK
ncbi:MAG TPA: 16S rRNA (cytosine(1402)-N(4))-methyltransferase RsmH [Patescibacteria group bacterium]|nr:16S rRNA (cytosine(1402)-N(4))-methyltransferase RsmH [Patescibacteria group bacterium]